MHCATPAVALSRRRLVQAAVASCVAGKIFGAWAAPYPEISWDALVPPDWDPMKSFADLQKLGALPDSDSRAQAFYERMRKVWDEAPTVQSIRGRNIRIPGFIVPLEGNEKGLREFLLVPYFGACIHTPPPPANQIIHVRVNPPVRGFQTMSAAWVSGTIDLERRTSELGATGYSLTAARVEKYHEK